MRLTPEFFCLLAAVASMTACGLLEPRRPVTWSLLKTGGAYTCGTMRSGSTFCWGGFEFIVGDGPHPDSIPPRSAVPLSVPGAPRFAQLAVGSSSFCGLDGQQRAFCWGFNTMGTLGDESIVAKRSPVPVAGDHSWRTIAASGLHSCAVQLDARAYCWGNQYMGALGNGGREFAAVTYPVPVLGNLAFDSIYVGPAFSCGIATTGDTYCWGINTDGQLGVGQPATGDVSSPVQVAGSLSFRSLALGLGGYACGLTHGGLAYCWGRNGHGQIGDGTTEATNTPTPVSGNLVWKTILVGVRHTCAISEEDELYCWGNNDYGQFGDGSLEGSLVPRPVELGQRFASLTAGFDRTCGLTAQGIAFCWGRGDQGELGHGAFASSSKPVLVHLYER